MAIIKISELPPADSPVSPSDVLPALQNGVTKKAAINQFGFMPNELGAVMRTIQSKLQDIISVKDFGVTGDGSDETAKLQAAFLAVTSGSKLTLNGLTVVINDSVAISGKSNFVIDGEGGTIVAKNGMPVATEKSLIQIGSCENFKVENITFDANRANRVAAEVPAQTVVVLSCKKFIFENVHSNNAVVDGFYFATPSVNDPDTFCRDFMLINCFADNCFRQGASVINGWDFQFIGGAYTNTNGTAPAAGIDVEANAGGLTIGNTRGTFIGVSFSGNDGYGLLLSSVSGSKTFTVNSCNFSQNGAGGIGVFTDETHIQDCYFADHSGAGVTQGVCRFGPNSGIQSGSVVNCTFENNTSTTGDIYLHSLTSGIRVRNNKIKNSGNYAIYCSGSKNSVVEENIVKNSVGIAILELGPDNIIRSNFIDSCTSGIISSGTRTKIIYNKLTDIVAGPGGWVQSLGTDQTIVGNTCVAASQISDLGFYFNNPVLAAHSNICENLNLTNPYSFNSPINNEMAFNNFGGPARNGVYTTESQTIGGQKTFSDVATFTANPILSAGIVNGVLYANASKAATSSSALTFDGSRFGIGAIDSLARFTVSGSTNINSRARFTRTDQSTTLELGAFKDVSDVPYIGSQSNHAFAIVTNDTEKVRITAVGNVSIGGTANRASVVGTNALQIFNGTAPVGTLSDGISIYSSSGEAYVMDAAGNATLFSPHDAKTNEWIFKSKHTPTGKVLQIDVEKLLRFVNDHFGLDAVKEFVEE